MPQNSTQDYWQYKGYDAIIDIRPQILYARNIFSNNEYGSSS